MPSEATVGRNESRSRQRVTGPEISHGKLGSVSIISSGYAAISGAQVLSNLSAPCPEISSTKSFLPFQYDLIIECFSSCRPSTSVTVARHLQVIMGFPTAFGSMLYCCEFGPGHAVNYLGFTFPRTSGDMKAFPHSTIGCFGYSPYPNDSSIYISATFHHHSSQFVRIPCRAKQTFRLVLEHLWAH